MKDLSVSWIHDVNTLRLSRSNANPGYSHLGSRLGHVGRHFSYLMKREQITERTQVTQERAQEYKAEHKLDGRENTILRISQCHKMERMEHCNGNRNEQVIKFEKLPWKRLIAWIIVQMTYTLLGAFLFIYVEECKGKRTNDTSKYQSFSKYLNNKDGIDQGEKERILNLTKSFFVITEERICKINHDTIAKWWQFTTVTCYTIGMYLHTLYMYYFISCKKPLKKTQLSNRQN